MPREVHGNVSEIRMAAACAKGSNLAMQSDGRFAPTEDPTLAVMQAIQSAEYANEIILARDISAATKGGTISQVKPAVARVRGINHFQGLLDTGWFAMCDTTKRNPTDAGHDTYFAITACDVSNLPAPGWFCITSDDCQNAAIRTPLQQWHTVMGLTPPFPIVAGTGKLTAGASLIIPMAVYATPMGLLEAMRIKYGWGAVTPDYIGSVYITWGNMLCDEIAALGTVNYEITGTTGWIDADVLIGGTVNIGLPAAATNGLLPAMMYHQNRFAGYIKSDITLGLIKTGLVGKTLRLKWGVGETMDFSILASDDSAVYVSTTGRRTQADKVNRWGDIGVTAAAGIGGSYLGIEVDNENFQQ